MKRVSACLLVFCWAVFRLSGQSKFEATDVHVSPKSTSPNVNMRGGLLRGDRYELRNATMVDLVRTAYGVPADRVVGGPAWLDSDRFDIYAKAPADATQESSKEMLKALLTERFALVVHSDTRPLPAYALTAGKKPQLKEADGTGEPGCKSTNTGGGRGGGPNTPPPMQVITCRSVTMAAFATAIPTMGPVSIFLNGNPVVDQTELKGQWDFELKISPLRLMAGNDVENITIFDAVEKQLGLKLQLQKVPLPVIVVDKVNQRPTENAPGVTQNLPAPAPTEFEVADVKPSDPAGNPGGGFGFQPGGRVNLRGMTLKSLIMQAYSLNGNDPIPGAPKWLETDRCDVIAKMASTEPAGPPSANGAPVPVPMDFDTIWLAMRALLADRFKLTVHYEEQPSPVYVLTAAKPKLTKANPENRTSCKAPGIISLLVAPVAGGATPTMTLTCQNITMVQFADRLRNLSNGDIDHPVVDATGLDGAWDLVIKWSPKIVGAFASARGAAESAAKQGGDTATGGGAASDPGGGLTMVQALEKQLGLKLELEKRPMSVLVIDHVEQKPTEN